LIDQRLKIAVFIDFDNIEIGVKTTLHTPFDIAAILDGIKERGEVVTKVAYGDWKRAGDYGRLLSQHAIRMVQRNLTPGGDKNGADINLALDALEMAFTHDHINAFVIVGGDSDFITLVEKLKQYDKKVFVVGGRQFTSQVMQKNCHEFIAYENLVRRRDIVPGPRRENGAGATADVAKAIPLVKRALKVLSDREVSPQLGLLKSTLLQLDSTFSERDYGVSTFRDFIEKLAKTGLVSLRHSGRSMMVDAVETDGASESSTIESTPPAPPPPPVPPMAQSAQAAAAPTGQTPRDPEQIQQIVDYTRDVFARAAQPPRWPMYVRQFKQFVRGVDPNFDERKWGFTTIMEFLRIVQREGLFRLERDRRGQMRVFPGSAFQRTPSAEAPVDTGQAEETPVVVEAEPVEVATSLEPDIAVVADEVVEEAIEIESSASEAEPDADAEPESDPEPAKPRRARKTRAKPARKPVRRPHRSRKAGAAESLA
jgi:uncharacterized LabA/DUF88 family protein